jgi:predicted nucleic acid-binding protein
VSGFLVDADILSESTRPRPHAGVLSWLERNEAQLYTSAVVIGEIATGIFRLARGKKRDGLERWLERELLPRFEGSILRFDTRVALQWAEMLADLEKRGRKMPLRDSLIAATALRHGLAIATRNVDDFRHISLRVVNPFQ